MLVTRLLQEYASANNICSKKVNYVGMSGGEALQHGYYPW